MKQKTNTQDMIVKKGKEHRLIQYEIEISGY